EARAGYARSQNDDASQDGEQGNKADYQRDLVDHVLHDLQHIRGINNAYSRVFVVNDALQRRDGFRFDSHAAEIERRQPLERSAVENELVRRAGANRFGPMDRRYLRIDRSPERSEHPTTTGAHVQALG